MPHGEQPPTSRWSAAQAVAAKAQALGTTGTGPGMLHAEPAAPSACHAGRALVPWDTAACWRQTGGRQRADLCCQVLRPEIDLRVEGVPPAQAAQVQRPTAADRRRESSWLQLDECEEVTA